MNELDNEEIVRIIADSLIGKMGSPAKPPETKELQLFADVYLLDLEIGSGASFEQYFRWSGKDEVNRILQQLEEIGLNDVASVTKKAIEIAFPNGVPENDLDYGECTYWTDEQDIALEELYHSAENIHCDIETGLANYAREKSSVQNFVSIHNL